MSITLDKSPWCDCYWRKHNDPPEIISSHYYLVVAYKQLSPAFERFYMINEVANPNFLLFYSVFTDCCFKKEKYFGIFVFAVQKLSKKCITLL